MFTGSLRFCINILSFFSALVHVSIRNNSYCKRNLQLLYLFVLFTELHIQSNVELVSIVRCSTNETDTKGKIEIALFVTKRVIFLR